MANLLRIDLTKGTVREENLPGDLIKRYIGGKGVGTHLLLQEVGPGVAPLSPENKLIFTIGPMAGTNMPGSNRYAAYFLSPLTNGYCESYSGGRVAAQFAKTGYQVLVLEGRAPKPVFLEISDRVVAFHDAKELWGKDTYESEAAITARVNNPTAQACVIGPAGENLVRFACIENNKWRSLGRGGAGAVMGSKHVKGIVFHGQRATQVSRPEDFKSLVKDLIDRGKGHPATLGFSRFGTVQVVRMANSVNMFPTHYWQKGRLDDFEALSGEMMVEKYHPTSTACPPCFLKCGKKNTVPDGPLAGLTIEGPEYETIYVFGGLCEIVDFAQIIRLNDICDRLGIDTMTAGNLCGLAIEACQQGKLDLGLTYGDAEGVADLLHKMVRREGAGDVFADGILRVEKEYGLEGIAVHVKGMEPAGYDPRFGKGMGLGYAMTARGACHMRATFFKAELSGVIEPEVVRGKAKVYVDWENRFAIKDSLIFCRFYRDLLPWEFLLRVVNASVGTDYSLDQLERVGNQIISESHEFNRRRGFGKAEEQLPRWITERAILGADGEKLTLPRADLDLMRREYYEARGWDIGE